MNKRFFFLSAVVFCVFAGAEAFAYNPPVGGENLFRAGHPWLNSQEASAAGGALFGATPQSIIVNPALTAGIQRVSLDAGYTGFFPTQAGDTQAGSGFQAGLALPSRWGVVTAALQGAFIPTESMPLGNTFVARAGFSRDVTDKFYLGGSLFGGFNWTGGSADWAAGLDLGFLYNLGNFRALRDVRIGVALCNIGKTFAADVPGVKDGVESDFFPAMFTPRAGVAAKFLDKEKIDAGFSADISAPFFQNAILDAGAQVCFAEIITLSVGWQLNLLEAAEGRASLMPSLGLSVKFSANTGKSEFMSSKGWDTSDFVTGVVWRQLAHGVHQVSAGVTANLGMRDTDPPVISLWEDGSGE